MFAAAQITSGPQTVALSAVVVEYVSLDAPSTAMVNFIIQPPYSAFPQGDVPVTFNTNYNVKPGKTVTVCAYLTGALAPSTVGNTDTISTGNVLAKFNGAGNFAAFDGHTACGFGAGLIVNSYLTTPAAHSVTVNNRIDLELNNFLGKVPDTYTGTLNLVAQAQ
jgi:hypothetical protein